MLWVLKMVGIFLIDSMSIRNDIWISLSDIFFLQGNIEESAAFCKLNVPFVPDNPCQGNQHMNPSLKLSIQMFALLCPIQK